MKYDLHPLLQKPIPVMDGVAGIQRPLELRRFVSEDTSPLLSLSNHHVVSARQFDRDTMIQLSRLAAVYESTPVLFHSPLAGKILISAFYEPSTRTRLSFESAWHRLGGDIMSITDPATTGMAKGESLEDVAEMFNNYGDVIVLRDNREDSVYRMLESLRIPILNAGNGIDEHPTQALSDVYTLFKWRPELTLKEPPAEKKIRLGIIGTPNRMRTVRSLLLLLTLIPQAIHEIIVINPDPDCLDEHQKGELRSSGISFRQASSLRTVLPELDVIYINSIAWIGDSYEKLAGDMELSQASPLKPDSIILHPLARDQELKSDLDRTPHNWYFAQARGAVFLRMALLTCLVSRINLVADVTDPTLDRDGPI